MAKKPPTKKITSLKLIEPFEYGGETVDELQLKRPSASDISDLGSAPNLGDLMKIGLKCAAIPDVALKLLSAQDGIMLANKVSDFLAVGQETGAVSKY